MLTQWPALVRHIGQDPLGKGEHSIFHGFDMHNGYLKPHNWSIFEEKKNSRRADLGPVLPP